MDLDRAPPGQQVHHGNDQRDNQQEMDERSSNVETPSKQPEHEQNRKDCPKHDVPLR